MGAQFLTDLQWFGIKRGHQYGTRVLGLREHTGRETVRPGMVAMLLSNYVLGDHSTSRVSPVLMASHLSWVRWTSERRGLVRPLTHVWSETIILILYNSLRYHQWVVLVLWFGMFMIWPKAFSGPSSLSAGSYGAYRRLPHTGGLRSSDWIRHRWTRCSHHRWIKLQVWIHVLLTATKWLGSGRCSPS